MDQDTSWIGKDDGIVEVILEWICAWHGRLLGVNLGVNRLVRECGGNFYAVRRALRALQEQGVIQKRRGMYFVSNWFVGPARTWPEHGRPAGGRWMGRLNDDLPHLIGQQVQFTDPGAGRVLAEFAAGDRLTFTTDTPFRLAPVEVGTEGDGPDGSE